MACYMGKVVEKGSELVVNAAVYDSALTIEEFFNKIKLINIPVFDGYFF